FETSGEASGFQENGRIITPVTAITDCKLYMVSLARLQIKFYRENSGISSVGDFLTDRRNIVVVIDAVCRIVGIHIQTGAFVTKYSTRVSLVHAIDGNGRCSAGDKRNVGTRSVTRSGDKKSKRIIDKITSKIFIFFGSKNVFEADKICG